MKLSTAILILLAGLPVVAAADSDADIALCTQMAQKFSDNPRGMEIRELDSLKTCINSQVSVMRSSQEPNRFQLGMGQTRVRASLLDDF